MIRGTVFWLGSGDLLALTAPRKQDPCSQAYLAAHLPPKHSSAFLTTDPINHLRFSTTVPSATLAPPSAHSSYHHLARDLEKDRCMSTIENLKTFGASSLPRSAHRPRAPPSA